MAQDTITYKDVDGSIKEITEYTVVTGSDFTWGDGGNDGWYVVKNNITVASGYTVSGSVKLILVDGCTLNVTGTSNNAGITVSGGNNSLTVYGQYEGTGTLYATGGENGAGIGGGDWGSGSNITINGGIVTAQGGEGGAGIGGGDWDNGSNITINGGTVTATGGEDSAGIGGGDCGSGSNITINGGTVTATGGRYGAGIGGGDDSNGSNITINGGIVTATGVNGGAGIGGGCYGSGSNITAAMEATVMCGSNASDAQELTRTGTDITSGISGKAYVQATPIQYDLTGNSETPGGGVTFTVGGNTVTKAAKGAEVTVAPVAVEGYYCTGFTSEQVTVTDNTFTMPAEAVTVTANYAEYDERIVVTSENSPYELTKGKNYTAAPLTGDDGGVFCVVNNGELTGENNTFTGNSAEFTYGGAIENYGGTVTLTDATFTGNSAEIGGAIDNYEGTVTLTGATFTGNSAGNGGAIYNYCDTVTLTGATFTGNSAEYYGGAIDNYEGTVTLTGATFTGNSAMFGGAIFNDCGTITFAGLMDLQTDSDTWRNYSNTEFSEFSTVNWNLTGGKAQYGSIKGFQWYSNKDIVYQNLLVKTEAEGKQQTGAYIIASGEGLTATKLSDNQSCSFKVKAGEDAGKDILIDGNAVENYQGRNYQIFNVNEKYITLAAYDKAAEERITVDTGTEETPYDINTSAGDLFYSLDSSKGQVQQPGVIVVKTGVYASGSNLMFVKSQGIAITNIGNLTIDTADFIGNLNEGGFGGAINNSAKLKIAGNATFIGNSVRSGKSNGNGGAICNGNGTIEIDDNATFTDNSAGMGGAIYNSAAITFGGGATFTGNSGKISSGEDCGGAIYNKGGTITFAGLMDLQTDTDTWKNQGTSKTSAVVNWDLTGGLEQYGSIKNFQYCSNLATSVEPEEEKYLVKQTITVTATQAAGDYVLATGDMTGYADDVTGKYTFYATVDGATLSDAITVGADDPVKFSGRKYSLSVNDNGTPDVVGDDQLVLTIENSLPEYELSDSIDTVYDGEAKSITVTVTDPLCGAVVYYSIDGKETWNEAENNSYSLTNATTETVTVYFKIEAEDYTTAITESRTISIAPKALSVINTTVADKIYDGTRTATVDEAGTLDGVIEGDDVDFSATGEFDDKNAGTNKDVFIGYTLSGEDAANYSISGTTVTADIEKKEIELTSGTASKIYDGIALTKEDVSITDGGFVEGEGFDYVDFASRTDVGITGNTFRCEAKEGTSPDNYAITMQYGTLEVHYQRFVVGNGETFTFVSGSTYTYTNPETYEPEIYKGNGGAGEVKIGGTLNGSTVSITGNTIAVRIEGDTEGKWGGGIYNQGTTLMTDSTFSQNEAMFGGGFYNNAGTASFSASTFSGNAADKAGGAIYNLKGSVFVNAGALSGNTAGLHGGAVYNDEGILEINSEAFGNTAAQNGGVLYNAGTASFSGNNFYENVAGSTGGAIYNVGTATLLDVWFDGNTAGISGGALYNVGTAALNNVEFSGNTAGTSGGAIYNAGTINLTGEVSLDTESDTFVNAGTVNWDLTEAGSLTGYQYLSNAEGSKLVLTVGTETSDISKDYIIAQGDFTTALTGKDTFALTGISGLADQTITVGGEDIEYNSRKYRLAVKEEELVLSSYVTKDLTITVDSKSKKYDGSALSNDDKAYDYTGTLQEGDEIVVTITGSITDAGTADSEIATWKIMRGDDDVSYEYNVTTVSGTLTVDKRTVTLTSGSSVREYDGTPLTNSTLTVSGDGFAVNEGINATITGSQTEIGTSKNTFVYTLKDGTKESNYSITTVEGDLTVTRITEAITITADSASKKYDGKALTAGYTYTPGILLEGDKLVVTVEGSITDAGTAANTVASYKVMRGEVEVTSCYTFADSVDGTLEITKRDVTLTSASASKTYDGTPLTKDTITVTGDGFIKGEGATYDVTGTQTEVGTSRNTFTYTLKDGTKADNYNITTVEGDLTVNKITEAITITADSASKKYDGSALTAGYTFTQGILAEGDELVVTVEGSITDVGTADNTVASYKVMRGEVEVTSYYTFAESVKGTLEITKRSITLTSATDSKTYDGTPLTNKTVTVTGDGFAYGEGAQYNVTGSQTVVGQSDNEFTYELYANTKADNYEIAAPVYGTLTVTKITDVITITAESDSKKYDGKALTAGYTYTQGILLEGDKLVVTMNGSITDAGTAANTVASYKVMRGEVEVTSCYTFAESVAGTLTVTRRDVTLTSASASKTYDGTPLTKDTITVTGDGFINGEGATYDVTGTQTIVGSSKNTFTYTLNDGTKESNYKITTVEGDLTVNKITDVITITADSASKMYDGKVLTAGYTFTQGILAAGDNLVVTVEGSITDVGTAANKVKSYKVMRGEVEVTSCYTFAESVDGTLEITKRSVTLTSASDTKLYDGTPLTNDTITVTGDGFIEGEGATCDVTGSQTEVGISKNTFTYTLNEGTKAGNYDITKVEGTLVVTEPIVITVDNLEKMYDGTALSATYQMTKGQLIEGDELVVTLNVESLKNVSSIPISVTDVKIMRGEDDVTSQYVLGEHVDGSLTVTKRDVTLTSGSASKEYDGTPLTNETIITSGSGFVNGESVNCTVTGSQTETGSSPNTFTYTAGEKTDLNNYSITKEEGTLTVTYGTITITAYSDSKMYDGTALTNSNYTYTQGILAEGDELTVTVDGSITDAGTAANKVVDYKVMRGGEEVTNLYSFTCEDGTLEITKRNVTLTSASDTKLYDGTPLTNSTVNVTGSGFINGEGATCNVTGSQTEVGTSKNTFTYTLNEGTKADNYTITKVEGDLTVTKITDVITITADSDSKMYDGTALTDSGFTFTQGILLEGDELVATVEGTITDAGTTSNVVTGYKVMRGEVDVTALYTFADSVNGTLTVTKRDVMLTSASASKTYDGTALTNSNINVSGNGFVAGEGAAYSNFASVTYANDGVIDNTFAYTLNDGTKASNYEISSAYGKLGITARPSEIAITVNALTKIYDGTGTITLAEEDWSYTTAKGMGLIDGDKLSIIVTTTGIDAGNYDVKVFYNITNADGNDVTNSYTLGKIVTNGLEITKRNVTLTSASDSKMYDGTPLTNDTITVSGDGFISGEGASCLVTGSQTEVGISDNTFTYTLNAGTKSQNYIITSEFGSLEVTQRPVAKSDINGNGISDILFQNLTDTQNPLGAWLDADSTQWVGDLGAAPKSAWTVYGAYDFTGDGVSDIMFRSKRSETAYAVGYYDMGDNRTFKTMGWGVTAEWELAKVGDFNGNGVSDILWKNTNTGYLGLWMDGTDQWVGLPASKLSDGQSIIGTGDVNGDGCDDILINSNGVLGAWDITGILKGTAETPVWSDFGIATVTNDWETIGCADFDGNGIADIVLWNDNGYIGTYMNCDSNDFRSIYPSADKEEWAIPGFGDFDGDGSEDVLVRNIASGALGYWDGNDGFKWNEIGSGVDSTWSVIA